MKTKFLISNRVFFFYIYIRKNIFFTMTVIGFLFSTLTSGLIFTFLQKLKFLKQRSIKIRCGFVLHCSLHKGAWGSQFWRNFFVKVRNSTSLSVVTSLAFPYRRWPRWRASVSKHLLFFVNPVFSPKTCRLLQKYTN